MSTNKIFALDIGTRSIVGIVGELCDNTIKILATERVEHNTRSMLDGQIHDIPAVAHTITAIKEKLEKQCGALTEVAVAAAGRALRTVMTESEMSMPTVKQFTKADEQTLELLAIQKAQAELITSNETSNIEDYYCVGHSVVQTTLDGIRIKNLISQQGKQATLKIIATFLPRQVVDSLHSAVQSAGLSISTMTLEPIAAINILIPPTMRHLNLVLVDIGAGTSDIAITKDHTIVAYGMVPFAGDEVTEALAQKFLLDFNDAEKCKQTISTTGKDTTVNNVLGQKVTVTHDAAVEAISPTVMQLAQNIATQIAHLNQSKPQAILLVGGGALTPLLPTALSDALDIPVESVAIRKLESIEDIAKIPPSLQTPDSITPLGILKIAKSRSFNFIHVFVNKNKMRLFNSGKATLADALISAGINLSDFKKRPAPGITVTINNRPHTIANKSEHTSLALINNKPAELSAPIQDGDDITVNTSDRLQPKFHLADVTKMPKNIVIQIGEKAYELLPKVTINGQTASFNTVLNDRDVINIAQPQNLYDTLISLKLELPPTETKIHYTVNGKDKVYRSKNTITRNGQPATVHDHIADRDVWKFEVAQDTPTLELIKDEILGKVNSEQEEKPARKDLTATFNGKAYSLPGTKTVFTQNGKPATFSDKLLPHAQIIYAIEEQGQPTISDLLLLAEHDITAHLYSASKVDLLLNGNLAEFTAPLNDGDAVELKIQYKDGFAKDK